MGGFYYLNGKIIAAETANISVSDRGLLYGDGLFETVRIYKGAPFLLEEHIQRLFKGAAFLEIKIRPESFDLVKAVEKIIQANKIREGFLRITLTRGVTARAIWPLDASEPTVLITASSSMPYNAEQYERGFRATLISFPLNENSPLASLKTLNYLENILGRREAINRGFDEGLFFNTKGFFAEGTASNLFLVKGGKIYTPPFEAGILPGITRNLVIKLASKEYQIFEENFSMDFLNKAEEAFLTNSLLEIMPLIAVEETTIGNGKPGKVTTDLQRKYKKKVTT